MDFLVVWNNEEDIASYVIHSIEDPRAKNKTIYICPPENVLSLNEVVSIWEEISGTTLQKTYISESKWLEDTKGNNFFHIMVKVIMSLYTTTVLFVLKKCYN